MATGEAVHRHSIGCKSIVLRLAIQFGLPNRDAVAELHFQPFELNPQMAPEGEDTAEHIARKYGMPAEQVQKNREAIRQRGAAVGFKLDMDKRSRIYNTFDAHRLLHWAGLEGKQRELKHALLRAYHGEGRNPGAHDILVRHLKDETGRVRFFAAMAIGKQAKPQDAEKIFTLLRENADRDPYRVAAARARERPDEVAR